ncbi:thiosulfate/3-mercaptopyruvate sulfurtransferase [Rhodococcus sp. 27YEA15]|uniref:sulfurtransferase n=1 Tax=Rhodococcus sp. 27YEA15 TaxID=3156259 RepID=UPI003C7DB53B
MTTTLISAHELAEALDDPERKIRVLDVRWRVDRPDGSDAYAAGHVPGAVFVDLDEDLSDHSVTGRGRHPLPSASAVQSALRRWGIEDDTSVVVYDDWNRAGSTRARWVLRAAGLADVSVLDGGWTSWNDAALPTETDPPVITPSRITVAHLDLEHGAQTTITADEAGALAATGNLLDARAAERFRGEVEPLDPVAGHIPGAHNRPFVTLLDDNGAFRSPAELRSVFEAYGFDRDTRVGVYCGSGVTATVVLTALEIAGYQRGALFPGSWSQWASESDRPTERGERPI